MVYCTAKGCSNRSEKGVRMYGFPADVERRKRWLAQVSRSNLTITKDANNKKICEAHFEADQFVITKKGKTRLKADAIPTIFAHRPVVKKRRAPTPRCTPGPVNIKLIAADHSYSVKDITVLKIEEETETETERRVSESKSEERRDEETESTVLHLHSLFSIDPNSAEPQHNIDSEEPLTSEMTSKKVIELFYDVVSPYSWLGFEIMCRYRHVWNIELKLRPAFLGGIMQGSGNKPPGLVPNKFLYMTKDLHRTAGYFGVPLSAPSDPFEAMFKKGSLSAMRFVTAVQEKEKDGDKQVEQVSRELWRRIWSEDKDITEPASLSEAALKAGLSDSEIKEALKLSTSQEIKDKLKRATQEALDHGSFGFPMVVCHVDGKPEMFFGSDRFELMAHCIGEKWLGPHPDKSAAKL